MLRYDVVIVQVGHFSFKLCGLAVRYTSFGIACMFQHIAAAHCSMTSLAQWLGSTLGRTISYIDCSAIESQSCECMPKAAVHRLCVHKKIVICLDIHVGPQNHDLCMYTIDLV